ncbi:MAG: hypothetical protein PGN34_13150 [Methylobacterium frigidaeris]
MSITHDVVRQIDPDGAAVVGVLLSNASERVWLDADAYAAVLNELGDVALFLGRNERGTAYVRLCNPESGVQETLARIITGRVPRTNVSYADQDRLNLRRTNLVLMRGAGGRPKRRKRAPSSPPLS